MRVDGNVCHISSQSVPPSHWHRLCRRHRHSASAQTTTDHYITAQIKTCSLSMRLLSLQLWFRTNSLIGFLLSKTNDFRTLNLIQRWLMSTVTVSRTPLPITVMKLKIILINGFWLSVIPTKADSPAHKISKALDQIIAADASVSIFSELSLLKNENDNFMWKEAARYVLHPCILTISSTELVR